MQIRDRIRELRRVLASDLRPHPKNWRRHPDSQADALRGVLAEVGFADALLARELPDGTLELIDGHLRAETTPDQQVPVLILDVDEQEAAKILATHDPLTEMAQTDSEQLNELIASVSFDNPAISSMLAEMDKTLENLAADPRPEPEIEDTYQVIVQCDDEQIQQELFERLTGEGYQCRVLTL